MTPPTSGADLRRLSDAALREHIAAELTRTRLRSTALTEAVDEPELVSQHSPLMSPLVWDYAHIANQEEIWLVRDVGGREAVRADIDHMYDAFKNSRADRCSHPPRPGATPARSGRRCSTSWIGRR
jgi:gamma-glutamyl hercynylcysteine S-oxide synthase